MKKITLFLLLFVSTAFYAQSTGISYQAIIYNPNGEVIPGYNNSNAPLANKNICLQFTIVDSATLTEYQEKITVTTDEYGMVNTVIGTGIQTGGYATSFANVNWSLASKRLKVGLDTFGLCTSFNEISNQLFTSVPYALAAKNAENISGVVPIANGGTGSTTVLGAKTNLGLENVDNTRDSNKPISTATQAALNLKEDLVNKSTNVITDGTSNTKYPSVKAIKDYVDSSTNSGGSGLANEAIIRANADLLKEDLINKSTNITTDGGSNTKYPSVKAIKDYVDVSINSGGTALTNEINTRAAADLLKEDLVNKSTNVTTDGASNTKYPSVRAIKTYVDASDSTLTSNLAAETTARIAGDNTLTSNLAAEISRATTIDNTLSNNVLQELIRATAAEATKEDLVNKSTNVTTDGTSNTKYPSVKSVKDYVDATVTTATALKENSANKSTDVTLSDATNVKFPTELAVKTYVNNQLASGTATNVSGVVAVANGGTGLTTFTSGQIPFGNGTGAIASSSNLKWDNSTGSLGVGTNTPGNGFNTKLDVVGRASFRTNGTNSGLIFDGYSPSGSLEVSRIYTDATSGTPSDFVLGTYPNGHLNQLYLKQSNGFVGVKTANPTTELEVNGTVTATSFIKSGGTSSQFLKADGSVDTNNYLTSVPPVSRIASTREAFGLTLSDSNSGSIIYSQHTAHPSFPDNLSDGFQCTIVNYSNGTFTSNTLSAPLFYTSTGGNSGSTTFTLVPGATALVNVVTINGQKRYYIKN